MKKYFVLALIVAAGLLLAPLAQANGGPPPPPKGDLVGVVLDQAGNPVPAAVVEVQVQLPNGDRFHARTRTDRRGRFEFRRIPAGPGAVRARKRGVGSGVVRGRIVPGQVVRARIVLS